MKIPLETEKSSGKLKQNWKAFMKIKTKTELESLPKIKAETEVKILLKLKQKMELKLKEHNQNVT